MKQFERILKVIICFLSSIYLTYILVQKALTTMLQVAFIYIYFLAIIGFAFYYYNNFIKKKINVKKNKVICFSFVFTTLTLLSLGYKLFPKPLDNNKILITATGQKDKLSKGKEVRITKIHVDGTSITFNNLSLSDGWIYMENENSIMSNPQNKEANLELYLPKGKIIEISFIKHGWSGVVEISNNNKVIKENLYDKNGSEFLYTTNGKTKDLDNWVQILLILSCILLLYSIFYLLIVMIYINRQFYLILNIVLSLIVFHSASIIILPYLFILLLSIIFSELSILSNSMDIFKEEIQKIFFVLSNFIITFLLWRNYIFLDTESTFTEISQISTFLLVGLLMIPTVLSFIKILYLILNCFKKER